MRATYALLKANVKNRALIFDLIRRDFKIRYLGSMLGSYWNFLHPIAMIAIYTVIFSHVFKIRLGANDQDNPFAFTLYLCAGMLPWTAFTEMVSRGTNVFLEYANLVKKVAFPKAVLSTIATGSNAITLSISLGVYICLILLSGTGLNWTIALLPVILLMQLLFATGIGLTLGVFNVFFRDIQQVLPIIFQLWFWGTPIVYTLDRVPERWQFLFYLNPYYYFADLYQKVLFVKTLPSMSNLLTALCVSIASYTIGSVTYSHFQDQIPDEL